MEGGVIDVNEKLFDDEIEARLMKFNVRDELLDEDEGAFTAGIVLLN